MIKPDARLLVVFALFLPFFLLVAFLFNVQIYGSNFVPKIGKISWFSTSDNYAELFNS